MSRSMTLLVTCALVLLTACEATRPMRGPVQPAPPGPMDALRSVWGDYSGRCPNNYAYCQGDPQSICCPVMARCCEDDNGAYCCGDDRYSSDPYPPPRTSRRPPPPPSYPDDPYY